MPTNLVYLLWILAFALSWGIDYATLCYWRPEAHCCVGGCPRCHGTGRRLRVGRRVYNRLRDRIR